MTSTTGTPIRTCKELNFPPLVANLANIWLSQNVSKQTYTVNESLKPCNQCKRSGHMGKNVFPRTTTKNGKTSSQDQQRFPLLDSAAARLVKIRIPNISNKFTDLQAWSQRKITVCSSPFWGFGIVDVPVKPIHWTGTFFPALGLCFRSVKLASPKLFRALNFTTLNFSSYAIWLVLTWQLLQYHTKVLTQ